MTRETIRAYNGTIIGFIDTDTTGDKIVRDSRGRLVGRYNKASNMTLDHAGRFLYRGDQSPLLLSKQK